MTEEYNADIPPTDPPEEELPEGQEWRWDPATTRWIIVVEGTIELTGQGNE